MECVFEKDVSEDTIAQVYVILSDYTRDYFTSNFPDDMRVDMRFQRTMLLKDGPEVVSCIAFTCLDGSPHITMMATRRVDVGRGYGRLLMGRFVEYVSGLGLRSIELYTFSPETRPVYAATVNFYRSVGFTVIGEYPDLWEPGTVTLKMRKSWL